MVFIFSYIRILKWLANDKSEPNNNGFNSQERRGTTIWVIEDKGPRSSPILSFLFVLFRHLGFRPTKPIFIAVWTSLYSLSTAPNECKDSQKSEKASEPSGYLNSLRTSKDGQAFRANSLCPWIVACGYISRSASTREKRARR